MINSKNDLRAFAKNVRKELDMKDISEKILEIFLASSFYKNAKNIAAYYPIGTEIKIASLFNDTNKSFFLPKTQDNVNKMDFIKHTGELITNKFNIPEPTGIPINPKILDIIILPALMADIKGYRLGYGGGYYDRFLAQNDTCATKIILLPEKLLTDKLPSESFDIPGDVVITEKRILKIQQL